MTKRFLMIVVLSLMLSSNAYAKILPDASPEEQYKFAISLIKVGDYENAELALSEFVRKHPKHELAGNAQYWYGETFRVREYYHDAAQAYLDGYQNYPKSSKGPINLLKLGVMLVMLGEWEHGCTMINGVKPQYPKALPSVLEKAKYENSKYKCQNAHKGPQGKYATKGIKRAERKKTLSSMIDEAKETCKELGFTPETEKFADCALKLYSQSVELAAKSNQTVVMQPQSSGSSSMTIYDPVRDSRALMQQGQRMLSGGCTLGINC